MAQVPVNDHAGGSATLKQDVFNSRTLGKDAAGNDVVGAGSHLSGVHTQDPSGAVGLDSTIASELVPGLLKDGFDEKVVKCGFANGKLNAMLRQIGYKPMKSMKYHYWSVDTRRIKDTLTTAHTISTAEAGTVGRSHVPVRATIEVADASTFQKTDQISFRVSKELIAQGVAPVYGYSASKQSILPYVSLNALVCDKKTGSNGQQQLEVLFLNADPSGTQTIPAGCDIFILGHAAANVDASSVPYAALPEQSEQFMQKFMVQSLVETIYQESNKEVDWGKADINELLLEEMIEQIERSYWFSTKREIIDPGTSLKTFTTGGILEQMIEGGSPVVEFYKDDLEFKDLLEGVKTTFIGNSGSQKRYMYSGSEVTTALWGIKDFTKVVNIKEYPNTFGYDFTGLDIMGYQIVNVPEALLDKMEYANYAFILDRQYVQRRVFRTLEENIIEMKKTGAYDGDSTVWCEISSVILKYPRTHALWIFHDGKKPSSTSGSSSSSTSGSSSSSTSGSSSSGSSSGNN